MRRLIDADEGPIAERGRERQAASIAAAALTFEKTARELHADLKPGWKSGKHTARWISTLETYVFPKLGGKPLDAITPADCAEVSRPIWLEKAETASRTHQRMYAVMQWAWEQGHITANPVSAVDHILPKQNARKEHQSAMPWRGVPAFVKTHVANHQQGGNTRAALLLLILTASRSSELRGATWDEFDPKASI
ncbi:Integrase [Paraburkholderia caribensis MBA4]|uniref:Integrase n=2 Tax=Paraburkholderia caribensis TaxID=75105 RepID=A0A0P0R9H6_9BURK|nr:Integrase [Paraburkholderia caribensis MBA4]